MMLKQENGAFKRVSTTTRDMCDYREVFLENLYTFVSMMKAGMPRKRPAYYD